MRLVWVELRRLFARRFFLFGSLALLAGILAVLAVTASQSHTPTAQDWARAEVAASSDAGGVAAERDACLESQRTGDAVGGVTYPPGFDCQAAFESRVESYLDVYPFNFSGDIQDRMLVLGLVLTLFGFLVGATVIGAEWNHGTLTTLLLWEPRRTRIFLAKLAALFIGVTATALVAFGANYAGHWGVARTRGIVGNLTTALELDVATVAARSLALALVAAAIGFATAFTLRRTAAAMGVALAYFGVLELGARQFFPDSPRFLALTYVTAWLQDSTRVFIYKCSPGGGCSSTEFAVSMWGGGAYLLGAALLVLVLAAVVFRRREVA